MKKVIVLSFTLLLVTYSWGQGCIAIRNVAGISPGLLFENLKPNEKFILNVTNRYFEASSTYIGDKYITDSLVKNRFIR
jgi:hypothetical protein